MSLSRRQLLLTSAAIPSALFLASCAQGQASSSPSGSADAALALQFVTWQMEEAGIQDWWAEVIAAVQDANPGLTIDPRHVESSDVPEYLATRIGADNAPQILHLPVENFPVFAGQGLLEPLDSRLAGTDILENWTGTQSMMTWEGGNQGVMIYGYPVHLFYNEALLEQAGVDVPSDPESLLAAAEALTTGDVYGFGTVTMQHRDLFRQAALHLIGFGGHWDDEQAITLTTPEAVAGLDHFRRSAAFSPAGVDSAQKRELFNQGKIAMMLDGPFLIPQFESAAADVKDHIRVARAPFERIGNFPANGLAIPRAIPDAEKDAAWKFIETACSPALQDRFVELYDSPAARSGAGADVEVSPLLQEFLTDADQAISVLPNSPVLREQFGEFSRIVQDGLMTMLTSDTATEAVLEETAQSLDAAGITL